MSEAEEFLNGDRLVGSGWSWLGSVPLWQAKAACKGAGPDRWFQDHVGVEAKQICAECPVLAQCLEFAVVGREVDGVWGGAGEATRRQFIRLHPGRPHPDPNVVTGCECGWCVELRRHLDQLDVGMQHVASVADRNGAGARHARRVTYARGCRCHGCRWSASATGQAVARLKVVDLSEFWTTHAVDADDYQVAAAGVVRASWDIITTAVFALVSALAPCPPEPDRLELVGRLIRKMPADDVGRVLRRIDVERLADEGLGVEDIAARLRVSVARVRSDLAEIAAGPVVVPAASEDIGGHGRTMADEMPAPSTPVPFLTVAQLAARWQVSDRTVWRMIDAGKLAAVRIGPGSVRFRVSDVEAFEAAHQEAA